MDKDTRCLAERMAAVGAKLTGVEKRGFNKFENRAYATADDILQVVRTAVYAEGVSMGTRLTVIKAEPGYALLLAKLVFRCPGDDSEVEMEGIGEGRSLSGKGVPGDKATAIATTYAIRNTLRIGFLLPWGNEDTEGKPDFEEQAPPPARQRVDGSLFQEFQKDISNASKDNIDGIGKRIGAAVKSGHITEIQASDLRTLFLARKESLFSENLKNYYQDTAMKHANRA